MKTAHDLVTAAKSEIKEITLANTPQAIQESDILLDVREPDEYASGHIPGAVHIPRGMLEFKLSSDPQLGARDLKIVLYCKTSGRAALAAKTLQEMGYLHVQSIAGGIEAWIEAGNPIAKPDNIQFE
jgi:rhodanese-related sulfurtransferase